MNHIDYGYQLAHNLPPQLLRQWASWSWLRQKLWGPQNYGTDCAGPLRVDAYSRWNVTSMLGFWYTGYQTALFILGPLASSAMGLHFFFECTRTLIAYILRPFNLDSYWWRGSLSTSRPLILPLLVLLVLWICRLRRVPPHCIFTVSFMYLLRIGKYSVFDLIWFDL